LALASVEARAGAYCPYSRFQVGAVLVCADGTTTFTGVNVENSSFGATICAERSALAAAVSAGTSAYPECLFRPQNQNQKTWKPVKRHPARPDLKNELA